MTQIRIDTEHARDVGRQLIGEGEYLSEIDQALQRAIDGLDTWSWEGTSRQRAEPLLGRVSPASTEIAQAFNILGRKLVFVADTFEEVDATAVGDIGPEGNEIFDDGSFVTDLTGPHLKFISKAGNWVEWGDRIVETSAAFWIAGNLVKGSTYINQSIFYGDHSLKEIAGLSSSLTHIKAGKIASHMAGQAFKGAFSPTSILLEGITEVGENWEEYDGETSKVAAGIVFDTALAVGCSAVGAGLGAFLGGAVGSACLGPVGAVIGGKIGGLAGSWIGGEVAEKIENLGDSKENPDDQGLDEVVVEFITEDLPDVVASVGEGIRESVKAVDRALTPFVEGLARLF